MLFTIVRIWKINSKIRCFFQHLQHIDYNSFIFAVPNLETFTEERDKCSKLYRKKGSEDNKFYISDDGSRLIILHDIQNISHLKKKLRKVVRVGLGVDN